VTVPSRRRTLRLGGGGLLSGVLGLLAGCSAPGSGGTATPAGERILALGDSYTVGTSVANEDRWVNELVEKRREAGHTVADPRVIAENGWTTGDLNEAIDKAESGVGLADEYDLVTLLIGANNCFQSQPPGEFGPKFADTLERAVGFAPSADSVVVITVPDYTLTPVGQQNQPGEHGSRLTAYNDIIEREAEAAGARLVDVVPPSKEVVGSPELIAEDDLHPAPEQYDLWLELIYPVAAAALDA
jgi:lysophospholipase L1-like esterase